MGLNGLTPVVKSLGFNPASAADASADADGDGSATLQEFLAGTNPHDPLSRLGIHSSQLSGMGFSATFSSVLGKEYSFECNDFAAGSPWTILRNYVPGTGGNVTLVDPDAGTFPRRFCRFRALP